MMLPANTMTLLADIGGTNTRVALSQGGVVRRDTIRRYPNAGYPGLDAVLGDYLAGFGGVDCAGACVAAAGPVRDGVATLTNLDWTIDEAAVARATRAETVAVLNDLQAQGHALGHLGADALATVICGTEAPRPGAAQLVIGVGTGFNAAPVHETPGGRIVVASECGHASLPVRNEADLRLLHSVEPAHGFAGVEDALSGRGLERVYAWCAAEQGTPRDWPAARIMQCLADGSDPVAEAAVAVFVRLLGRVTGDLGLNHLPFGGIYLIGGVARAMQPHFHRFGFAQAFRDKGRFSDFMDGFSVHVIEDDYAALTGCAVYLDRMMRRGHRGAGQSA